VIAGNIISNSTVGNVSITGNILTTGNVYTTAVSLSYTSLPTFVSTQKGYIFNPTAATQQALGAPINLFTASSIPVGVYMINSVLNVTTTTAGNISYGLGATVATAASINGFGNTFNYNANIIGANVHLSYTSIVAVTTQTNIVGNIRTYVTSTGNYINNGYMSVIRIA
jgi:hypothetical protein